MSKPMHILIVPSWYPSFKDDIKGSFFREQAIALTKYGHKVGVISPQIQSLRTLKQYFILPRGIHVELDEKIQTYRWYYLNTTPKLFKWNINKWVKKGLKLFERYMQECGKPDIIHVHSILNGAFLASEIKKRYNIPFVITEHSTAYARGLVDHNKIPYIKSVLLNSSANIAVSNEFKFLLNNIFDVNTWCYIPNIVNQDFLNTEIIKKNNKFTYINICLLEPKKKVDNLIYAFKETLKKYPHLQLEIGGGGSEKVNLELLVNDLDIADNVKFLGKLTRKDVKIKMSESSVFVLSSDYETFGVVIIEAIALGKPVIATKCGGPESIINSDVGILVEKGSIDQLSEAMIEVYENYENYNSQKIREYCKENFSEKAVINQLNTIYKSVLEA